MPQNNMEDFIDEILFEKKKKKKMNKYEEVDIKKILEAEEETDDEEEDEEEDEKEIKKEKKKKIKKEEDEETDDEDDIVLEVSLSINNDEDVKKISSKNFKRRAITDFLSLVSMFRDSTDLNVRKFVDNIGLGTQEATSSLSDPIPGEEPADAPGIEKEEDKLVFFSLAAKEEISNVGKTSVIITGEENINNLLSFKISVGEESTPFNEPSSAIAHFNRVFFDNIVKIIDKELESRNE